MTERCIVIHAAFTLIHAAFTLIHAAFTLIHAVFTVIPAKAGIQGFQSLGRFVGWPPS
jgi:hypothetical protein